jgi:hypothetical protein
VTFFALSSESDCLCNALLTVNVLLAQLLQIPAFTIQELSTEFIGAVSPQARNYAFSIRHLTFISPTLFPFLSTVIVTGLSGSSLQVIFLLHLNLHDVPQRVAYGN